MTRDQANRVVDFVIAAARMDEKYKGDNEANVKYVVACVDGHGGAGLYDTVDEATEKAGVLSRKGGCVYAPMGIFVNV